MPAGVEVALVGKTHFAADEGSFRRLGIWSGSQSTRYLTEAGFDPVLHYEGHANPGPNHKYTEYLRRNGYASANPWDDYVIGALDERGRKVSGWAMRNVHLPALVAEQHSETAYTTDIAMRFVRDMGERPWLMHLSYIKPHWPYLAPAPYHALYGREDCLPVVKHESERQQAHPVVGAYQRHGECQAFSRDEVAYHVRPAYMGLVKQIDDHLGRLFAEMERLGRLSDTLIVFTADHGDYLGDHWLGDKDLFHEPSARIPFIVYDPDPRADMTRGRASPALVEGGDFLPTALEALGLDVPNHLLEGRSVLPLLRGGAVPSWREVAVSEIDYSFREARVLLRQDPRRCRGYMLAGERWKYIYWEGFREQLYDLSNDPWELQDRGTDPACAAVLDEHRGHLFDWVRNRKLAVTLPDQDIVVSRQTIEPRHGIRIGEW
jgi:arylsulfatase A-like enzyme